MRGRSTTTAVALGIVVLAGAGGFVIDDAARAYRAQHSKMAPAGSPRHRQHPAVTRSRTTRRWCAPD